jgi:energy-coupling factor transporter ATP-binding protein EcfA2
MKNESLPFDFHYPPCPSSQTWGTGRSPFAAAPDISPRYILLDEPFSGIDPISIADVQKEIHALREDRIGVIVTDHGVRKTLSITDFAYLIDCGQLVTSGRPAEVVADPAAEGLSRRDVPAVDSVRHPGLQLAHE